MIPVHCLFILVLQQAGFTVLPCLAVTVGDNLHVCAIEGVKSNPYRDQSEEVLWDEGKIQRPLGTQRNMFPSIFFNCELWSSFPCLFYGKFKVISGIKMTNWLILSVVINMEHYLLVKQLHN